MSPTSPSPAPTRRRSSIAALVVLAALALSACGASHAAPTTVLGVPSFSISVPLSQVACAANNVCVAAGTSTSGVAPLATGEFMTPAGVWHPLATPQTPTPQLTSAACEASTCLLAGSQGRRDLLWRFDVTSHQLSAAPTPVGGVGVLALTCYARDNCAMIDLGANAEARFSFTADAGATWSTPIPLLGSNTLTVTSLQCGELFHCLLSAKSASATLIESTNDGGVTWRVLPSASASWTSLELAWCRASDCVALATGASDQIVRSSDFGQTWSRGALVAGASAVACTSNRVCVVGGATTHDAAWLATLNGERVTKLALRYVPTALLRVACGTSRCAGIGVTTVLSLPIS